MEKVFNRLTLEQQETWKKVYREAKALGLKDPASKAWVALEFNPYHDAAGQFASGSGGGGGKAPNSGSSRQKNVAQVVGSAMAVVGNEPTLAGWSSWAKGYVKGARERGAEAAQKAADSTLKDGGLNREQHAKHMVASNTAWAAVHAASPETAKAGERSGYISQHLELAKSWIKKIPEARKQDQEANKPLFF